MADNITQARRVVGQFLAQNRGSVQTPGAVQQLVDSVDQLVRGTSVQLGVMPYIQRLEAVGDDDAAIGFARGLLRILNRPSQRSAKAEQVIAAAKAVGVKRQPSPSDAVMWEHWIPKYRQRIAGMIANPNEKDIASYAGTLKDLTRHMTDSPRERAVVLEASKTMYRALRRAESGEIEDVQIALRGVVSKLQSIE